MPSAVILPNDGAGISLRWKRRVEDFVCLISCVFQPGLSEVAV